MLNIIGMKQQESYVALVSVVYTKIINFISKLIFFLVIISGIVYCNIDDCGYSPNKYSKLRNLVGRLFAVAVQLLQHRYKIFNQ